MLPGLCLLFAGVGFVGLLGVRVAQEYERGVVFRLGRYRGTRGPGLYWMIPFLESQRRIDLRTATVTLESQETVTRDSVTIKVNAVLWFHVVEPSKAVISVMDYRAAVYQLALTTLRNIVGQHLLDEVLKERSSINQAVKEIVDAATRGWGVVVEAVEMKDVEMPQSMQYAMAVEAEAIREKRARIIKAEAEEEAARRLSSAARLMYETPAALELRRFQMVAEVGAENNSTTVVVIPSDFVHAARSVSSWLEDKHGPGAQETGSSVDLRTQEPEKVPVRR